MRLVLWLKGERGAALFSAIREAGHEVVGLVLEPGDQRMEGEARDQAVRAVSPADPHSAATIAFLRQARADVFVLNGYRRILKPALLALPRYGCINLHAGKLPEYRGSSPMNWALINGEHAFTLSVIRLEAGIDTGPVLAEKRFAINDRHTIRDLHEIARKEFPLLALRVLSRLEGGRLMGRRQSESRARYFPARFPSDGLVNWELQTAKQVHDRIRALTEPYPCAYAYLGERKILLIASEPVKPPHYGEPGRIYQTDGKSFVVAASDRCLRILEARLEGSDEPVASVLRRYQSFRTCRSLLEQTARASS